MEPAINPSTSFHNLLLRCITRLNGLGSFGYSQFHELAMYLHYSPYLINGNVPVSGSKGLPNVFGFIAIVFIIAVYNFISLKKYCICAIFQFIFQLNFNFTREVLLKHSIGKYLVDQRAPFCKNY